MRFLHPEFLEIIKALNDSGAEYLIIGGYAVNYHGFGRPTGDLDIWLKPDNENKVKCIAAFRTLKYKEHSIDKINTLDFKKPQVFYVGEPPLRIEFLTQVNLVKFDEAWETRETLSIESVTVPVMSYKHLVLTKISTGRTQDKLDLEELQKIKQHKDRK